MRLYHLTNPLVIASDSTLWLVIHLENSATPISFKWVAIVCAHQLLNAVFFLLRNVYEILQKRRIAVRRFILISVPLRILQYLATILRPLSSLHLKVKEKCNLIQTLRTYPAWRASMKYPSVTDHFRLGILTLHDTAPNHLRRKTPFVRRSERRENSNSLVSVCYRCILPYMIRILNFACQKCTFYWGWKRNIEYGAGRDFIISGMDSEYFGTKLRE